MMRTNGEQERLDNLAELKQSIFEFERTSGEENTLEEYKTYNPAIESVLIPDTKHLPQLESPAAFYEICETFLGPE